MLLNSAKNTDWKLINYRTVGDLIAAEFLHDLYNQAEIELNPVHFRNTMCVVENGMFKSYAPQEEWNTLAEVLGENLIHNPDTRNGFSTYLERSQKDLIELIDTLKKRYTQPTKPISGKDTFYDLSRLHFLALDRIYAINLVQFEHALGYAIDKMVGEKRETLDKFLKSSSLTMSGQEELKALKLSVLVSEKKLSLEEAAQQHKKEFSAVNLAYGATQGQGENDSLQRIQALASLPIEEREARISKLSSIQTAQQNVTEAGLLGELTGLAKKLGERRDRNKALMGKVAEARKQIMAYIAESTGIDRSDLSLYFLQDIFKLLTKGQRVSSDVLEDRRNRIVISRRENTTHGVEAIHLSEQAFPNFFKERKKNELEGVVASSGKIMGRVHKVYSIDDARKIKKDEIMVAFGTDFDLMIGLQNCAAVITEEGGLLSHASVISRELGKPCLINVKNAMSTLQDGYLIELDTTKKKISILDKKVESKEQSKDVSLLSELSPEQIKGAKARNLRILFEANIPILPGIIANIRKDSNLEQIAREIVQKLLQAESLGTSCIVRSNSENEDTTENSMAGQYTSIVCQTEKKLLMKAIQDVISSYAKPKIATLTNATDEQNSVLIQPYYPQQYGGVAFSHNPLNKKEGVVLEASRFGAGAVVEGKGVTTTLPQNIKTEVEKTVHKIQEIFGRPMDVEWGYGEDGLKIFQARPIVFTTHHQDKTAIEEKKKLTIIAGGQGSRIKSMFQNGTAPFTKHFLPLPEKGGSIIGAIIEKSKPHFDTIELSGSKNTLEFLRPIFTGTDHLKISEDATMIGPLYPPFQELIQKHKRVYACCGDIYSNFNWDEMEAFHNQHGGPITILIAHSFPSENAACFSVGKDGKIVGWERKKNSTGQDLINIGAYILDPKPEAIQIAQNLIDAKFCKEDVFFEKCIEKGILNGYTDPGFACNINIPSVYYALVQKISANGSHSEHGLRKTAQHSRDI